MSDKKTKQIFADMKKIYGLNKDQITYHIPLSQSLIQNQVPILFHYKKAEKSEEILEVKLVEIGSWGLRKKSL